MSGHDEYASDRNGHYRNGHRAKPVAPSAFGEMPQFLRATPFALPRSEPEVADQDSIRWIEAESRFIMNDEKVVTRANRGFCVRLIEVLIRSGRARAAQLDFRDNRLAVTFADQAMSRSEAARVLGESIRLASMPVATTGTFEAIPASSCWDSFAFFCGDRQLPTTWWWTETSGGRVRLDGPSLNDSAIDPRVWTDLIPGVRSSRPLRFSRGVSLKIDPERVSLDSVVDSIDDLCRILTERAPSGSDHFPVAIDPLSRMLHLGLAACSMSCAIGGILVPGVPTVPFVLLTSYHLSRCSVTLQNAFRRTPLFGSLGDDWATGRFIRPRNKIWLISISTTVLVVSLSMNQFSNVVLVTIMTIFTMTTASVLLVPISPRTGPMPQLSQNRNLRMLTC
jgi:uncharacterized membrane protein YbaN (DUF454 family)